jgi:hypothetical protein
MGLSSRLLLIPADAAPRRLAEADFVRLCRSGGAWRVVGFPGARVRSASLVVELVDRQPVRVVHRSFAFLHFDETGMLDVARLNREQAHRMDAFLAPVLAPETHGAVIHASSRFKARGGSWKPDAELLARLDAAALGRVRCPRIRLEEAGTGLRQA